MTWPWERIWNWVSHGQSSKPLVTTPYHFSKYCILILFLRTSHSPVLWGFLQVEEVGEIKQVLPAETDYYVEVNNQELGEWTGLLLWTDSESGFTLRQEHLVTCLHVEKFIICTSVVWQPQPSKGVSFPFVWNSHLANTTFCSLVIQRNRRNEDFIHFDYLIS